MPMPPADQPFTSVVQVAALVLQSCVIITASHVEQSARLVTVAGRYQQAQNSLFWCLQIATFIAYLRTVAIVLDIIVLNIIIPEQRLESVEYEATLIACIS